MGVGSQRPAPGAKLHPEQGQAIMPTVVIISIGVLLVRMCSVTILRRRSRPGASRWWQL